MTNPPPTPTPNLSAIIAEAKKLRCSADSPVHGHICICPREQMCQDAHANDSCIAKCKSFAALLAAASRGSAPPVVSGEVEALINELRELEDIEAPRELCGCEPGGRVGDIDPGFRCGPCRDYDKIGGLAYRAVQSITRLSAQSAAPCGVCGCLPGVNRATGKNRYLGQDALAFLDRQIEADESRRLTEMDELRTVLTALDVRRGPDGWTKPGCECGNACEKSPVCAACGQPERIPIDLPAPAKETK